MPSIFDMFDDPDETPASADGARGFDSVLEDVIRGRPVAGRPPGFDPANPFGSSVPQPDGEDRGADAGAEGAAAPVPPETPPPPPAAPPPPPAAPPPPVAPPVGTPPAVPAGPLADLSEMETLELSQLRQALRDPESALRVRRAMLGVEPAPPPAPSAGIPVSAPAPPAEPQLPDDIDPNSFEATLWRDNQEMKRQIAAMTEGQQAQRVQSEADARQHAAARATQAFSTKYAGRLTEQEIEAIAQTAGARRLPDAFRPTMASWDDAMNEALEFQLRSNDVLLARVLGVTPPAGATPPPGTPPPTPAAAAAAAAADPTRRRLTALSSAATPSGEAATRAPIETDRPNGGKMTEKSRMQLVQELIRGDGTLLGTPGEG